MFAADRRIGGPRRLRIRNIESRILLLLICLCSSLCNGKSADYVLQETPAWENKVIVDIKELLVIGTSNLEEPDSFFSYIMDIFIDHENNIYILDQRNGKAAKFNKDGKFDCRYGNGRGQGPGEFQFASDITADSEGVVYISDRDQGRVSIFSPTGKFLANIATIKSMPLMDILAYGPGRLFVGVDVRNYLSGRWKEGIFQFYSLPDGGRRGSIGKAWKQENSRLHVGGNSICVNKKNGHIIVSYALPYLIEEFSKDCVLLRRFGRKVPSFEEITEDRWGNLLASGSSLQLSSLPDGKMINMIRQKGSLPKTESRYAS